MLLPAATGALTLIVSVVDLVLYAVQQVAGGPGPMAIAVLERVALLLVLVARDLVIKPEGADQPGAIRLLQLFTYNYRRAWPESRESSWRYRSMASRPRSATS